MIFENSNAILTKPLKYSDIGENMAKDDRSAHPNLNTYAVKVAIGQRIE